MEDKQTPTMTKQNRVTVRYLAADGRKLNEDLSVFGAVGSAYRVTIPNFKGYWLTEQNGQTVGKFPDDHAVVITLKYAALGGVVIKDGDQPAKSLSLTTSADDASKLLPIKLPSIDEDKHYYYKEDGVYQEVAEPAAFMPDDPTQRVTLSVLSQEAADAHNDNLKHEEAVEVAPEESKPVRKAEVEPETPAVHEAPAEEPAHHEHVGAAKPAAEPAPAHSAEPDDIRILLAKALRRQADVLDLQADQNLLSDEQQAQLLHSMREFMRALLILTKYEEEHA